ncbi:hypothetical protein IMG5_181600 [Ichthyophthirius multifiliis]|uniref:Transmembrane protein n=1 Tax=Ichthyophthirius multifiliis TaxID=5932 RepID=G0R2V9_ICHMU|nr:hypothetical protein IMG5_181600 [Ichthyophthirius multifiliis]EGR28231.1 hypothetical protein IMG5_181600 [Ichthyophthirius multifiliis]|eukprot:XP_004027576.1 hypothetical protein IMG5_181600 [Ichthyophthirius multifiliis]
MKIFQKVNIIQNMKKKKMTKSNNNIKINSNLNSKIKNKILKIIKSQQIKINRITNLSKILYKQIFHKQQNLKHLFIKTKKHQFQTQMKHQFIAHLIILIIMIFNQILLFSKYHLLFMLKKDQVVIFFQRK